MLIHSLTIERILWVSGFVFCLATGEAHAQEAERVFPQGSREPLLGVVETNDRSLYIAGTNNTLERSTNGGMSWEKLNTGEYKLHYSEMVTDGSSLYMIACPYLYSGRPEIPAGAANLILCKYNTQTGQLAIIPGPLPESSDTTNIVYHSIGALPTALLVSYRNVEEHTFGLAVSSDGGSTWRNLSLPDSLTDKNPSRIYTRSGTNEIMIAAGRTLAISRNAGQTWDTISAVNYDALVYLGNGRILIREYPSGTFWLNNDAGEWTERGYAPINNIVSLSAMNDGTLIACGASGGMVSSVDTGKTWIAVYPNALAPIFLDYHVVLTSNDMIVAVNNLGEIYISNDRGVSWSLPRQTPQTVGKLYWVEGPQSFLILTNWRTGRSGYYLTRDDFASFEEIIFPGTDPKVLSPSLWYTFSDGSDTLVYASRDGGISWEASFIDSRVRRLEANVKTSDSSRFVVCTTGGMIQTTDGGMSWGWIQTAQWSSRQRPVEIGISPYDGSIWYSFKDTTVFSANKVVRGSLDHGTWTWSTMLTLSEEERKTVSITGVLPLDNGAVMVVGLKEQGGARTTITWHSDDNGESWQSYELRSTSSECELRADGGAKISSRGSLAMRFSALSGSNINNSTVYVSSDLGRTDSLIFETSTFANLRGNLSEFDESTNVIYYYDPLSIYRISSPAVTSIAPRNSPPLPLSIGTPFPHPVTRTTVSTMLLIRSERTLHTRLTILDLAGREYKRLYEGELGPEGRHVTWYTGSMAPGVYVLQLESDSGIFRRMVLLE